LPRLEKLNWAKFQLQRLLRFKDQDKDLVVLERDLVDLERDLVVQERDLVVQERDLVVQERDLVVQERDLEAQDLAKVLVVKMDKRDLLHN